MLQLLDVRKSYTTADFTQTALDDVSISFRSNEFVAILGPSGSGKTTMLNIVGGLDQYDSGDLVIDGVSTKEYKDRDWDTYRNNRIGFVFQSYNLIPHQTILSNVELALTLSGVGRAERKERARQALTEVGLGDHVNKKPNQLSGGQMQRVAVARALINDPEILLADEPTGALDSTTSVQIMELLTEIAKDRLVVMVTHNPELAEKYATRIVNLRDGVVRDDSDPFDPEVEGVAVAAAGVAAVAGAADKEGSEVDGAAAEAEGADDAAPEEGGEPAVFAAEGGKKAGKGKKPHHSSMSFFTAVALSFNNLMTKKGRTIMTAFAGSIGIIGIASILALANGVNNYIQSVEEDMLTVYPLSIESTGFDMTSMMVSMAGDQGGSGSGEDGGNTDDAEDDAQVSETKALSGMLSGIGTNDLKSLKKFLESGESDIDEHTNLVSYSYGIKPLIYSSETEDGVRQINPNTAFNALSSGSLSGVAGEYASMLTSSTSNTSIFFPMLDSLELLDMQYDVVAGKWPEDPDECILVLNSNGSVTDVVLYTIGLRDPEELDQMIQDVAENEDVEVPLDKLDFTYDEIMDISFKIVNSADLYQKDEEYNVWKDKSEDEAYMKELIKKSTDMNIVGIVQPKEDANATSLNPGICYPSSLQEHLIEEASKTQIVKDQLADPKLDVITGRTFEEEREEAGTGLDLSSMFTVDGDALSSAFYFDGSKLTLDMSGLSNLSFDGSSAAPVEAPDLEKLLGNIQVDIPPEKINTLVMQLMSGFLTSPYYPTGETDPTVISQAFSEYLYSDPAIAIITAALGDMADSSTVVEQVQTALQGYMQTTIVSYMSAVMSSIQSQIASAMTTTLNQLSANMAGAMGIDEEAFKNAFNFDMDESELQEIMMSFFTADENTYENNLKTLGYADTEKPTSISIYPKDFQSKGHIVDILDDYNKRMEEAGDEDKIITYTDIVGTLMSSVTTIVDMISYVLVAFVSISLVVSSIMIGIITYISVLERKKEIGILRAMGASKKNIRHVFNAETLIVGLVAGLIGVGVTALCCIPANIIIYDQFAVADVASLPVEAAITLVLISMFLSWLAGLIPSSAASRKDPVEALRSE